MIEKITHPTPSNKGGGRFIHLTSAVRDSLQELQVGETILLSEEDYCSTSEDMRHSIRSFLTNHVSPYSKVSVYALPGNKLQITRKQ